MRAFYDRESPVVVNGVKTTMVEVTLEPTRKGKRIPYADFDTVAWCPTIAAAKLVADALNRRYKRSKRS